MASLQNVSSFLLNQDEMTGLGVRKSAADAERLELGNQIDQRKIDAYDESLLKQRQAEEDEKEILQGLKNNNIKVLERRFSKNQNNVPQESQGSQPSAQIPVPTSQGQQGGMIVPPFVDQSSQFKQGPQSVPSAVVSTPKANVPMGAVVPNATVNPSPEVSPGQVQQRSPQESTVVVQTPVPQSAAQQIGETLPGMSDTSPGRRTAATIFNSVVENSNNRFKLYQEQVEAIQESINNGEVSPRIGYKIIDRLKSQFENDYKIFTDYAKKISDARKTAAEGDGSEASALELKTKAKAAFEELRSEKAFNILMLSKRDPELAIQEALANDMDPKKYFNQDGTPNDRLKLLAMQSKQFKNDQEIKKEGSLPAGYFRRGNDPQIYKMGPNGTQIPVTTEQVEEAENRQRKSGATNINTGETVASDKKLLEGLGTANADAIIAANNSAEASVGIFKAMGSIKSSLTNPDGSIKKDVPLGPGGGIKMLSQRLGLSESDAAKRAVAEAVKMQSSEAELVAAGRMKGQGQITESERLILRRASSGDIQNFTAEDWVLYASAQQKFQKANIEYQNDKIDKVASRHKGFDASSYKVKLPDEVEPQVKSIKMITKTGKFVDVPETDIEEALKFGLKKVSK